MSQAKADPAVSICAHAPTKSKSQYRTAAQWREIVDAFQCSTLLTRTEFCEQHGVAVSGIDTKK